MVAVSNRGVHPQKSCTVAWKKVLECDIWNAIELNTTICVILLIIVTHIQLKILKSCVIFSFNYYYYQILLYHYIIIIIFLMLTT